MTKQRRLLISEARKWPNTPFLYKGRTREGVDCIGLLLCVCADLGLNRWIDEDFNYPECPVGNICYDWCNAHMTRNEDWEPGHTVYMEPGNVVLFKVPDPVHIGIVTDFGVIHSVNSGRRLSEGLNKPRCVIEHSMNEKWLRRVSACFKIPNVI